MRRIVVLFAVAACGDQAAPAAPYVEVALIAPPSRDLDVLFVIDDSINLDMQTNLENAFPALLTELSAIDGQLPNLHIGVVTSDLGTNGYADAEPGPNVGSGPGSCAGYGKGGHLISASNVQGSFIIDVATGDGSRDTNYTTTLVDAFRSLASVGAAGCGFEQPLEAMRIALIDSSTGFLRPHARLAVITLQDEDDCSFAHSSLLGSDVAALGPLQSFRCTRFGVTCEFGGSSPDEMATTGDKAGCSSNDDSPYLAPVARYREVLESIKDDPRTVMFAAIAGPPAPVSVEVRTPPGGGPMNPALAHSCAYSGVNGTEVADPAVRVGDLVTRLRRGDFESVCDADLGPALHAIGGQLRTLLGDSCLPRPATSDCRVYAERSDGQLRELPSCPAGDCYELVDDATCGGGAKLHATWATTPSPDVMLSVRCR